MEEEEVYAKIAEEEAFVNMIEFEVIAKIAFYVSMEYRHSNAQIAYVSKTYLNPSANNAF